MDLDLLRDFRRRVARPPLFLTASSGLIFSVGTALISHNCGVPGAPQLFLLPLRAAFVGLAALLAPFGIVLALQACARLVHMDIGIDSMYVQLFELDPAEGSVAQMEVAGKQLLELNKPYHTGNLRCMIGLL